VCRGIGGCAADGRPPTGTVTFLFTGIAGSTDLCEEDPEAMWYALARHERV
jgi:class 3 adenylate cyclase